jgi:hypothetical protein
MLDVARAHQCSIVRRKGNWEFLETPERKQAKQEMRRRTLGISPRTVDFHPANLLKKLGARNAADLVHKVLGE